MAKNANNQISRNNSAVEENSEIKIYLDTKVLGNILDEYSYLLTQFDAWTADMGVEKKELAMGTEGETSTVFYETQEEFDCEVFGTMYTYLKKAIEILFLTKMHANALIARCEDFYEILCGGGSYEYNSRAVTTTGEYYFYNVPTTMINKLYLDTFYYGNGGGLIVTDTDALVSNFKILSCEADLLKEELDKLEVGGINIEKEYTAIKDDCDRKSLLNILLKSFEDYVSGVDKLNSTTSQDLDKIVYREFAFDNPRTYEYPYVTEDKEVVLLNKIIRRELHEMGIDDELIDNALNESSFTLASLAKCIEAVIAEDYDQGSDGEEIELVKTILSGKYDLDKVSKLAEKLADKADTGWCCIAMYQMGLVHTEYSDGNSKFSDEGYKKYMALMNALLKSEKADEIMLKLKKGADMVALQSYSEYLLAKAFYDADTAKAMEEIYNRNALLSDAYKFINAKMDSDHGPALDHIGVEYEYEITAMHYSNDGITLDFSSHKRAEHKINKISEGLALIDNPEKKFSMAISRMSGQANVDRSFTDAADDAAIEAAWKEEQQARCDLIKDVACLTSNYFVPGSSIAIEYVYMLGDDVELDDIQRVAGDVTDASLEKYYEHIGGDADRAKELSGNAIDIVGDVMKIAGSTAMEDAKTAKDIKNFSSLAGEIGRCEIKEDGSDTVVQTYANPHVGIVDPNSLEKFETIAKDPETSVVNGKVETKRHGLSEICNWNEKVVEGLEQERNDEIKEIDDELNRLQKGSEEYNDKLKYKEEVEKNHEIERQLIEGGYAIDENTNFSDLEQRLNEINKDYANLDDRIKEGKDVYAGWNDSGVEENGT